MPEAVIQEWLESEAGWGQRPDGYSVHLSFEDHSAYCANYWEEEKKRNPGGRAPAEYSRENGSPLWCEIPEWLYKKLQNRTTNPFGIRLWNSDGEIVEVRSKRVFKAKSPKKTPFEILVEIVDTAFETNKIRPSCLHRETWDGVARWHYHEPGNTEVTFLVNVDEINVKIKGEQDRVIIPDEVDTILKKVTFDTPE